MDGDASKLTNAVFGVNPTGVGGDQDTVNACNVAATVDPWNFSSDSGPTFRMLADMSDPDKFYVSLPLGQSEHLFSPYKTDQLHNWLRLEPHSIAFSPAQLEKQQQHKVIFTNQ
jgi:acyl-homoserine lactone acylase PvdQ